ncbi:alpha/beta fold hydrolase [Amycolatopsis pigmentata]|uniref:Alpha/beta fold hydrolase n=1 Tax=Amycolatopsis pigmentata TaxID=450801 RepID=A0ABW5FSP0_9PSEU
MPTVTANGATIAYHDEGPRDAPTVLFGHGLLFGGWMFRPQIAALRDRYRCVTLDWRGQGESPAAAGDYGMDTLAADAVALIGELGLAPVHWVGLSMGGFVGQRLAARHPHLLRSLTLLGTSAAAEDRRAAREYKLLGWFQRFFGVKPVLGNVAPLLFGPTFLSDPASEPIIGEWAHRLASIDRSALRRAVFGVADRAPVEPEITTIVAPTLVVTGADDRATPPERARRIAALIPGAELHIIGDCGHSSTLEQPSVITKLLDEFLTGAG